MYTHTLNSITSPFIFLIVVIFGIKGLNAQDAYITGPMTATVGEIKHYVVNDPFSQIDTSFTPMWFASGSQQAPFDALYADIQWNSPGTYHFVSLDYYDSFGDLWYTELQGITVSVGTSIPAPTLYVASQPNCTTATGSITITNYSSSYTYTITPSTGVVKSGNTITAPPGTYTVTAAANGATSPTSNSVIINPQPNPSTPTTPVVGTVTQPTIQTATGSVTLTGLPTGSWTIQPGTISGSGTSYTITGLTPATYSFKVTNISGCISSASSNVVIYNQPSMGLSDENYIYTVTPQIPVDSLSQIIQNDDKIETVNYFDGLGRPMQSIGIHAGGNKEDVISHIAYDGYGRQNKEYLPYAETTYDGYYRDNAFSATADFYNTTKYNNTTNPYSESVLETSPLNRVLKQAAPGEDWKLGNGHEIEFEYQSNIIGEVRQFDVALTAVTTNGGTFYDPVLTLSTNTEFYSEGELYKTITKDENHDGSTSKLHTTEEFKDKQGMVVLKRTYANVNEQPHDTYYIYDDYGNLTYVLPPQMNATTNPLTVIDQQLNGLGYQYTYDYRNRLIKKRIPGKAPEEIVYDKLDRPIFTQDGNLKVQDKWLFTKYDVFGRVVYTGIYSSPKNRKQLQKDANDSFTVHETKEGQLNATLGDVYYTNNVITTDATNVEVLTVNYYDNYDFDIGGGVHPGFVFSVSPTDKIKGLATGSKVKVLDDDPNTNDWITTVSYYDEKARPIHIYSHNEYLVTTDKTESKYDFTGRVIFSETEHTKNGTTIKTKDNFIYDHMGRLTKQSQIINNVAASEEIIVKNTYDELGQLISKGVGGKKTAPKRLQNIDYTYNIRGWLKQINDTDWLGKDLFAFKINYNTVTYSGGHLKLDTEPLYNGNISETIWKTANDNKKRGYGYRYDALNRITDATYKAGKWLGEENQFFSLKDVVYDKNGNIQELIRNAPNATFTDNVKLDKLFYKYKDDSNQLSRVSDMASTINTYGFKDYNEAGVPDYDYDANGNMIEDKNKHIGIIKYNHLNLPAEVLVDDLDGYHLAFIEYVYDALGNKLSKRVEAGNYEGPAHEEYVIIEYKLTEYAGNYVYETIDLVESGTLKFFNHPEGYVEPKDEFDLSLGFDYIYQFKDHLGNIRLSYKDSNNDGTVNSSDILEENNYYPFGLKHKGYNNVVNSSNKALDFKYNGVELEESLGLNLYEMELRQYDPAIGRWTGIDPVTHYTMSPYVAFDNNPIYWSDPSGADSFKYNWDTEQYEQYDDDGKLINDNASYDAAIKWAESQNSGDNDEPTNVSDSDATGPSLALIGAGGLEGYQAATATEAVVTTTEAAVATGTGMSVTAALTALLPLLATSDTPEYPPGRRPRDRVHVTYTKIGPNGEVYVGRASGFGTPQEIVARRDASHHMTALGFGIARLDVFHKGVAGRAAVRGREQQLIDSYGGALSDPNRKANATSANAIRGVARYNPNGYTYHKAASMSFGEAHGFTGVFKF
ncbi:DUF6443 domain-containing protein [Flavivirga amylovorans]|uniref:DUF6443 domain-containing protein n=1 Tax=Flavivirga amylovorans TaxID=870486 RepID=A0ABT8WXE3_9FLAO|nr:DUF6443 domain-containing protein [Flavivirga amylovorans]MDO5986292.1 DUF6443 domain-containing protein [Flavivirga amylovorans]